jgi:hypothetical protein
MEQHHSYNKLTVTQLVQDKIMVIDWSHSTYNFTSCFLQAVSLSNACHALSNCLLQAVSLCNACHALTDCYR